MREPLQMHGRNHRPGGSDPIPNAMTVRHAGYYWSNNSAAGALTDFSGATYYQATFDFLDLQWGEALLDISDPDTPTVTRDGVYSFHMHWTWITGQATQGSYAGKTVEGFFVATAVPSPLFGNGDVRFPANVVARGRYPQQSSEFTLPMLEGDAIQAGFRTDQASDSPRYSGFASMDLHVTWFDVTDLTGLP